MTRFTLTEEDKALSLVPDWDEDCRKSPLLADPFIGGRPTAVKAPCVGFVDADESLFDSDDGPSSFGSDAWAEQSMDIGFFNTSTDHRWQLNDDDKNEETAPYLQPESPSVEEDNAILVVDRLEQRPMVKFRQIAVIPIGQAEIFQEIVQECSQYDPSPYLKTALWPTLISGKKRRVKSVNNIGDSEQGGMTQRERKMAQNRLAATRYRQKLQSEKKERHKELETMEMDNVRLKSLVSSLTGEIGYLKRLMTEVGM